MNTFTVAHSVGEDWAHAAQGCADALVKAATVANLGFLYVTDSLAEDVGNILVYLRQRTGIEHWVGTVGIGICANEAERTPFQTSPCRAGAPPGWWAAD